MQKESKPFVIYTSQVPPQVTAPALSHESIQYMIDTALDRQARATYQSMRRLLEDRDSKQATDNSANVSSSSGGVHVPQTDNPPSVASAGVATHIYP